MLKFVNYLILAFLLLTLHQVSYAQCAPATSIAAATVTAASCPGNGQIVVGAISPAATSPDFYQYRLMSSDNITEIKPWQNSSTFTTVVAGSYRIWVRKSCTSGISDTLSTTVTVGNTYVAANIASTSTSAAQCCNGYITVNAVGSAPLQYSEVSSLAAPDIATSLVKAKQSSNIFDSMCVGTHYMRVYDACGGFATTAVVVGTFSATPTLSEPTFRYYACDSITVSFGLGNFRNRINTPDTAISKMWIEWPTGAIDSVKVTPTGEVVTSIFPPAIPINYAKLDASYDPLLPFPKNIHWPKTVSAKYKDACGNIFTKSVTLNFDSLDVIVAAGIGTCDSVAYTFSIFAAPDASGRFSSSYIFGNNAGVQYSVDGGSTWQDLFSTSAYATGTKPIKFARGISTTIKIAFCGDTIRRVITPAAFTALNTSIYAHPYYNNDCLGTVFINAIGNAIADSITVVILSAPASVSPIPAPVRLKAANNLQIYNGLPYGTYTFRIIDSVGSCFRTKDTTITLVRTALDMQVDEVNDYSCTRYPPHEVHIPHPDSRYDIWPKMYNDQTRSNVFASGSV